MKIFIRTWYLALIAGITTLAAIFVIVTFVYSFLPIAEWNEIGYTVPPQVKAGQTVTLCRKFDILREVDLVIRRSLVCDNNGLTSRYVMPTVEAHRVKGYVRQCRRDVLIPENAQPGKCQIETIISWEDFPFWHKSQVIPSIGVEIIQ